MMYSARSMGIYISLWGSAVAFQLYQPLATLGDQFSPADGWTPRPTSAPISPSELFERRNDPGLCGYIQGDAGLFATALYI